VDALNISDCLYAGQWDFCIGFHDKLQLHTFESGFDPDQLELELNKLHVPILLFKDL